MSKANLKPAKHYNFMMEITVPCVLTTDLHKPKNEQEEHTKTIKSASFKKIEEERFIFGFRHKEKEYQFEMTEKDVKNYVRIN